MSALIDQPARESARRRPAARVKSAALATGAGVATGVIVVLASVLAGRWT